MNKSTHIPSSNNSLFGLDLTNPQSQVSNNTQPQIQIQKSLDMVELDEDLVRVTSAEVWKYFQGGVLGIGAAHKYRVKIKFQTLIKINKIFI